MRTKLYPFSGKSYREDIDLRRLRVATALATALDARSDYYAINYLEQLESQLEDLLGYMFDGVVWLPNQLYKLVLECVVWAAQERGRYESKVMSY